MRWRNTHPILSKFALFFVASLFFPSNVSGQSSRGQHREVNAVMTPTTYSRFIRFLREDLAISDSSIAVAQRHREQNPEQLPMILWQYGLVTLEQLDRIFDWLETA